MIECDDLVHAFGERTVLRGVTFHVPRGSVYGFIGPNGAGKTTTIRVLSTLLAPTFGTARLAGHDVVADPEAVRRVMGYMPDNAGVYERFTAREYLEFFASAQGVPSAQRASRVAWVVELTDLGSLLRTDVRVLSKGQRQRLLLARTLLHDPEVLILDEPASDLDPRARIELRTLLATLARLGKTVLLSSHILTELADICDWVGILEDGKMAASGPISEVQERLRPGRRVRVQVLERVRDAEALLQHVPGVVSVRRGGEADDPRGPGELEVAFVGDEWRVAEIVTALTRGAIPVVAVEPERTDLERIFMDVTSGRNAAPTAKETQV
jgi:ABC-2 type transport system ATP-binding protein